MDGDDALDKPKIGLVIGSVRENRFADKAARWFAELAGAREDLAFETVDLKDYSLPFFADPLSPAYAPSPHPESRRWQAKMAELDGYVFTAAEYNRGPTGVLKNALDHAYREYNRKPVAFVGYGSVGGARAVEQLRLIAVELGAAGLGLLGEPAHVRHIRPAGSPACRRWWRGSDSRIRDIPPAP
jgi:NAD(P)H-dependent FMN reductase